jgi:hypothetical protein
MVYHPVPIKLATWGVYSRPIFQTCHPVLQVTRRQAKNLLASCLNSHQVDEAAVEICRAPSQQLGVELC